MKPRKIMRLRTCITIPSHLVPKVEARINEITKLAGGCTMTVAQGQWINESGDVVAEEVYRYEWWCDTTLNNKMESLCLPLVGELLNRGEECVLIEGSHPNFPPFAALLYHHH